MGRQTSVTYLYQHGTEAENYYHAIPDITHERVRPQPKLRPKRNYWLVVQCGVSAVLIFGASFLYVHTYSELATKQRELGKVENQLREVKSMTSETQAAISAKLNLDYIRERALKDLDMREPLPHQIVYLEISKQGHTVYE